MAPPLSIHRVVVVSLFLPYTVSFDIDKEREVTYSPVDINLTVPKPNLIERLAAKRADGPVTPSQQIEDPINKLFPSKGPITPPPATGRIQPRSRAQKPELDNKRFSPLPLSSRRVSIDSTKVFDEAPWTVEPCTQGNIGLQNAINSVAHSFTKRVWIGTLGMPTDVLTEKTREDIRAKMTTEYDSIPVIVADHDIEGHYNQFCKQVLWPTFHYVLPENPKNKIQDDKDTSWKHYVAINQSFADTITENYQPGDIIWVNDYHLLLVPGMIRKKLPNAMIGFFLHIPFPSSEIFRCLPVRKELLEGVLGADLIGFQTYSFARYFLQTCSRILSLETTPKGIQLENNFVSVGIFPIGIDIQALNEKRKDPEVREWIGVLGEKYHGKKLVVGRDKLDYVKGVRQKMLAFETFLTMHPEWQGKVVLIQVVLSTTEQNELQSQVSDVVARINSKFSNLSYQPVVYLHKDITFSQYLALLSAADMCLITSLRDGMNLTSHEYVICQEEKHRPLILSEFAGTYGSFGAAIRINPWDYQMLQLNGSAQNWTASFVSELEKVHSDMQRRFSIHIPHLSPRSFLGEFKQAQKRLILLDYDGTLAAYEKAPNTNASTKRLVGLLTRLTSDSRNVVYVMSGRTFESLEEQLGEVPNLGMSAENGSYLKLIGGKWENLFTDLDMSWRDQVDEIFEYYTERTPGSLIEKKNVSVVWHYRTADNSSYGAWQAAECQNHIQDALGATYPIHAIAGNKNIEVMPRNINKSVAVRQILTTIEPDFILCMGDDRTDEDMFEFVNKLENVKTAITCTVGSKSSEAKWFVSGVLR
ncbi:9808_t:CDS:10 [Funneliformis mosseae]|uniref:9808_t:CDS:1 n=1 Tax=Funneliformis mosseae TaxID=27381 RepID=A0A9N9GRS6_FUNMO|nr:9808_t:CDS:10 [Funneliformis mosseae]